MDIRKEYLFGSHVMKWNGSAWVRTLRRGTVKEAAQRNVPKMIASTMTPKQELHLSMIRGGISAKIDRKYRAGQLKHGGNLWDRNPVRELSQEITDAAVYMHCIEEREKLLQFGIASIAKLLEKPDKFGIKSAKKIASDLLKELAK